MPVRRDPTPATSPTGVDPAVSLIGSSPPASLIGPSPHASPVSSSPLESPVGSLVFLTEEESRNTPHAWSNRKKWGMLWVVALCQTSMNYNAAVYSNAVDPLNEYYGITNARIGMVAFLVTYAFGCELWAPWSEDFGRWPIMQISLTLVNLSQLLPALSVNFSMVLAGRILGGLSSAGGSVTLGMVADMFMRTDMQQWAVLFATFWSCIGSVIGAIFGGVIEDKLHWRWNFWIQLLFGIFVQAVHLFGASETLGHVVLRREVKQRRAAGENVACHHDYRTRQHFLLKTILKTIGRPFYMLATEPIVLFLSLLSGFADALIFSFFEAYGYIYGPSSWNFSKTQIGLSMLFLLLGYVLATLSYLPIIRRDERRRREGHTIEPEKRLWWLQYLVMLLPLGLLASALVIRGPPLPWILPLLFSVFIAIANFAIYYATLDYMVAAYGV